MCVCVLFSDTLNLCRACVSDTFRLCVACVSITFSLLKTTSAAVRWSVKLPTVSQTVWTHGGAAMSAVPSPHEPYKL